MNGWPWHPGELEAQARAGGGPPGSAIRDLMPEQHRQFFAALPFVAIATSERDVRGERDAHGWPVATLLQGAPGFVSSPDPRRLRISTRLDAADPATRQLVPGAPVGLLGIDLATRRRNRENGVIESRDASGLVVAVQQSFGNCPQYIHVRELQPAPASVPADAPASDCFDRLDREAGERIARADTFFVASSARSELATGGVDISHRGGPAGFVRVDGDWLTIPDFRGNRYFNTLGNLIAEPRAALLFVDFARGDLLHVQGSTEIIWDGEEVRRFPGAERLWRVQVARGWRRRGAFELRST